MVTTVYLCVNKHRQEPLNTGRRTLQIEITPEWISVADAQRLVGLGRTSLWKLTTAGEIRVARVGRAVRINRASLEEYMQRQSEGGEVATGKE